MHKERKAPVSLVALGVFGILLISSQIALAKGNFSKIVISGGQLTSEIELSDPALLGFFTFSDFPNAHTQKPPVGEGYIVTRYFQNENGAFIAWDRLHYYPADSSSGGYVFYDGLIGGSSEYDGQWYTASPDGDAAFRRILMTNNPNAPISAPLSGVVPIGLAGVVLLVAGIAAIKRRTRIGVHPA